MNSFPKPFVELAIQIARGSADFLKKDLVAAVGGLKDEQLRVAFQEANRKAANALNDYAAWLEREKLPKASLDFALGEEKFRRFLAQTELVDLPPQKVLEIGMAQLKAEQEAFAEAAKKIDPNKSPIEVFKQIQSEHPTPDKLIPDVGKDLDKIRKYVLSRHMVSIPSEVRAKVKETPQYLRATSFASMDTPVRSRSARPRRIITSRRRRTTGRRNKNKNGSRLSIITLPTSFRFMKLIPATMCSSCT